MIAKTIAGAFAALLLLAPAAGAASEQETEVLRAFGQNFMQSVRPSPKIRAPGPRNEQQTQVRQPIQLAQAGDPRIVRLEEQIRQLNGLVEELNFQVLQMQDQLRRMQEDNEFRFQQLEGSGDGVMDPAAGGQQRGDAGGGLPLPGDGSQLGSAERGEPPRALGQITFDAQGNPVVTPPPGGGQAASSLPGVQTGPALSPPATAGSPIPGTDGTQVAALPRTDNAEELYRNAYQFILSGDYGTAEAGFREHAERFPDDQRASDVQFWLGEALLAQARPREAAQVFLAAGRAFPQSRKAPEMMLKLGVSLAAMDQKDVACATLAEVARRYPDASAQVKTAARDERQRAAC